MVVRGESNKFRYSQ